jgi:hypothetical protein
MRQELTFPLIFTSYPAIQMQGWPDLWFHPFTVERFIEKARA